MSMFTDVVHRLKTCPVVRSILGCFVPAPRKRYEISRILAQAPIGCCHVLFSTNFNHFNHHLGYLLSNMATSSWKIPHLQMMFPATARDVQGFSSRFMTSEGKSINNALITFNNNHELSLTIINHH